MKHNKYNYKKVDDEHPNDEQPSVWAHIVSQQTDLKHPSYTEVIYPTKVIYVTRIPRNGCLIFVMCLSILLLLTLIGVSLTSFSNILTYETPPALYASNPTPYPHSVPTTKYPTDLPTRNPTVRPSLTPTAQPSDAPTTRFPTAVPSLQPTNPPAILATNSPVAPTKLPTEEPTTRIPSLSPTVQPTEDPTMPPTKKPTGAPVP